MNARMKWYSGGLWVSLALATVLFLVGCGPTATPTAGAVPPTATQVVTVALATTTPITAAATETPIPPTSLPTATAVQEEKTPTLASTPVGGAQGAPQKAVLTLDWVPNTNHSGFYVALDKGWYKDEGLDLEIQIPSDPAAALKQVAFGHTEFGVSFEEEVTIARAQKIPVVSIAAIIQHQTSAFAALKGKGITRPKDFEGKKYASYGVPLERPILKGLMECDGGDVNKVEFVDVGFDAFPALVGGKVDLAWIFLAWDGVQAEIMNKPLDTVPLAGSCVPDYYTPVIVSGEKTLAERPEIVRRFVAATAKGYRYAVEHPDEAAEILIKHSPETSPDLVRRSQKWLSPRYQDDAPAWGVQKLQVWQEFGKWMADRGLLAGPFKAEEAFTNDFLPK